MIRAFFLAKNILQSNWGELRLPYRMTYIVTHRCQCACQMCNIWKKSPEKELTLDEVDKFFSKANHFSWINLSGGELSLRKDFPDIVGIIHKRCPRLYLLDFPTNGIETGRVVDLVTKIRRDYPLPRFIVTVSLDGPQELHDRIRGVPGAWDRAVATFGKLRAVRDRHFDVFLGMTLQDVNRNSFESTLAAVRTRIPQLREEEVHINIVHASEHYYENTGSLGRSDKKGLWDELERVMRLRRARPGDPIGFLEKEYQRYARIYLEKNISPVPCQALRASFFMDPQGTVYPCVSYSRALGNIKDYDYDLYKLWCSSIRQEVREAVCRGQCPHCWTPCEAYQSLLANVLPRPGGRR